MSFFVTRFNYSIDDFESLTLAQAWKIIHVHNERESFQIDLLKNELRTLSFFIVRGYNDRIKTPKELFEIGAIDDLIIEREDYEYNPDDFKWIYDDGHLPRLN